MSSLSNKKCVPCSKSNAVALSKEQVDSYLSELLLWELDKASGKITREIKCKDFIESLSIVNKIADIANREDHHPDIEFGWGYCRLSFITHSIGALHENDFVMAAKIEEELSGFSTNN